MNSDLAPFATLTTLREALRAKRLSATELTQFYLRRIAADETNSFITVCAEQAQAEARRVDAEIARNGQRDLLGLPIAHKDAFCTNGVRTTCASKMLADFVAPYDATAVANLKAAGAITLGKTNMDEFAVGSSNETSHFGDVANPWDANRVPGGSSGGSAAAVAAGLVPAATATDTGGSIRQPAAFCGVSGLKPTYGRISRFGLVAFASSLDQGGAIARSAADLRLMLRGMEGHDPRDSTSVDMPPTPASGVAQALRIGVPTEYCANLHADVAAALDDAAAILERLGHRRQEITLPHTAYACAVYYVISEIGRAHV